MPELMQFLLSGVTVGAVYALVALTILKLTFPPQRMDATKATVAPGGLSSLREGLRYIAKELLGDVDIIAKPEDMEEDFASMIRSAMSRGVSSARLRV